VKTVAEKRLFWFLKEGTELDLSNKSHLDMHVQQSLSRGRTSDIKKLFEVIKQSDFIDSLNRIKGFLSLEVKKFWEEWLADINRPSKKNS
jgi:hypothetical protein